MRSQLFLLSVFYLACSFISVANGNENDSSMFYVKRGNKYFIESEYKKCESDWQKVLQIRQKIFQKNSLYIGYAYNNLGILYIKTWDFRKANEYLEKAKTIFEENGMTVDLAVVISNIGNNQKMIGNLTLAEQYYQKALLDLHTYNTPEARQRKGETLNRLGILEKNRGNYAKAIDYYNAALLNYKEDLTKNANHNLYLNLTRCLILNKNDSAKVVLNDGMDYLKSTPKLVFKYLARYQQLYAQYYLYKKHKQLSYDYLNKTKELLDSTDIDSSYYIDLFLDYAEYHSKFEEYPLGLENLQNVIRLLTKKKHLGNLATPTSDNYSNPILGIRVLKKKANLLIKLDSLENNTLFLKEAINAMLVASELVANSRNSFLSVESKLALAENESAIYQIGIYASALLYKETNDKQYLNSAFHFSEKSKSSVLEGTLQEQKAMTFGGIPDSLLANEEEFKRNIAFYKELLHNEQSRTSPDPNKIKNFRATLFDYTEKNEKLKNKLEKFYPNYFELKYSQKEISIVDLQKVLNSNTTVLEYTLADSNLYIFQIDNKNTRLFSFKVNNGFYKVLNGFIKEFKTFHYLDQGTNIFTHYEQMAYSVYLNLLEKVNTKELKDEIIIIPDNILSYIPFEALVKSKKNGVPCSYMELDYLNNHHAISYSYTANLLLETSKFAGSNWINRSLSVAPNYGNSSQVNIAFNDNIFANQRNALWPLPFAKEEVELVNKATGGIKLIGEDATEETFLELSPDYQILHLAMHTLIDDKNPLFSKLVFSTDSSESGFLTTNEIFSLKLSARMTVLSACSSGEGELKKGEGVLSLARSFFYAGCPSLVMTLWNVDDKAGLTLIQEYYKCLKKGNSKPTALQKAKISYLEKVPPEKQHPYFWANYISVGNPSALYIGKLKYMLIALGFILTILAIISLIRKINQKVNLKDPLPDNLDRT